MPRSRENLRPGQQLYTAVEFCQDPANLWGKIESGHWDWLGVRERDGRKTYVVGSPPIGRSLGLGAITVRDAGANGRHQVVTAKPHFAGRTRHISKAAADAEAEFERTVRDLRERPEGSGLYRVSLYLDGELAREEFDVRAVTNVLK